MPVSYTHLDVYKRQTQQFRIFRYGCDFANGRKRKNYKLRAGGEDQNTSAGCVAHTARTGGKRICRAAVSYTHLQFLQKLPEEKRCMFVLRYWYVDSIGEIAERLGRSENYISVSLNRIRGKLHTHLTERGFEL